MVIRVVRIGDSQFAPNFELVAQPNDWEKQVKQAATVSAGPQNAKAAIYSEFWTQVLDKIRATHPAWTRGRTSNQNFCDCGTGTSGVVISQAWQGGTLRAQIYFGSADGDLNRARFESLHSRRAEFELALGESAEWDEMAGRKGARIVLLSPYDNLDDRDAWPAATDWLIQKQAALREALRAVGGIR